MKRSKDDLGDMHALSRLKNRGGQGQQGVGIIDGSVMTVQETVATTIAKDIIDDARRGFGKATADLTVMELQRYAQGRTEGRACTDAQVLAECMRIINKAKYGPGPARR